MLSCYCCRRPRQKGSGGNSRGSPRKFSLEKSAAAAGEDDDQNLQDRYRRKEVDKLDGDLQYRLEHSTVEQSAPPVHVAAAVEVSRPAARKAPSTPPATVATTVAATVAATVATTVAATGPATRAEVISIEQRYAEPSNATSPELQTTRQPQHAQQPNPPVQPRQQPKQQHKHQHHEQPQQPPHQPGAAAGWVKVREPHEHQHGYSVFQSDEHEVTIVDSDYSDFEDDDERPGDLPDLPAAGRSGSQRATATLSVVLNRPQAKSSTANEERKAAERLSSFLLASENDNNNGGFGWQTLPNGLKADLETVVEEEPITLAGVVEEEPITLAGVVEEEPITLAGVVEEEPITLAGVVEEEPITLAGVVEEEPITLAGASSSRPLPPRVVEEASAAATFPDEPSARESLYELDRALAVFELIGEAGVDLSALPVKAVAECRDLHEEEIQLAAGSHPH